MIKKLLFLCGFLFSYFCGAMNMNVVQRCADLESDGHYLKRCFTSVFKSVVEYSEDFPTPSDVFDTLWKCRDCFDVPNWKYLPFGYYIIAIGCKQKKIDTVFKEKLAELQSPKKTWMWFASHFEREGLKKIIAAENKKILKENSH